MRRGLAGVNPSTTCHAGRGGAGSSWSSCSRCFFPRRSTSAPTPSRV